MRSSFANATPEHIANQASGFMDIPWKDLGRDRSGCDCLGLALMFFRHFGVTLPDPLSRNPKDVMNYALASFVQPTRVLFSGDLIAYSVVKPNETAENHIGIVVGNFTLHTSMATGSIITRRHLLKVMGYYRLRCLASER